MNKCTCINPDCNSVFTPGRRHPNQKCCFRPACRRYLHNLRGKRYYARHCPDKAWYRRMLARKREERERRRAACPRRPHAGLGGPSGAAASPGPDTMFHLLAGMTAMLTGSRDASEVRSSLSRCLDYGRELFNLDADTKKSSSPELFLTLVRAESCAVPDAGHSSTPLRC